jgi:serine/threonine protein kinase
MVKQQADSERPEALEPTDEYRPAGAPEAPPIPLSEPDLPAVPAAAPTPSENRPSGVRKTSVLGDFRLVARLGEGGMGTVYRARQISRPRDVAVKVLSKELASKASFVQRFRREARLLTRLDHAHIIRCYAVGQSHGYYYLAMELAGGGSVQTWLERLGKLAFGDAIHIALACARALAHAHDLGMVHRDVKPDNLLLSSEGTVKLGDLGLAKAGDESVELTETGIGIGTPLYAPPEQSRDAKHADARSDLYALGGVLYHLLAGQPPFAGDNFLAVLRAKEKGVFTPLRRHRPELPREVEWIMTRLLARLPEQRYPSCHELIEDLQGRQWDNPELSFLARREEE